MSIEIHFGEITLRDNLAQGLSQLRMEPVWQNIIEPAFRSAQPYGRGSGNASMVVRFNLLSQHTSVFERLAFQTSIFAGLHGGDLEKPRELWIVDTALSDLPFSFGLALANPPKILSEEEGHDGTGYIAVTQYEFVCSLLPTQAISSTPTPVPVAILGMPNLWIPNAYGLVIRRQGDDAWMRLTWDLTTEEPVIYNLGSDPGTTNYFALGAYDAEWADPSQGFGLFQTTPTTKYLLAQLNNLTEIAPLIGTATTDFTTGKTLTKGITFGIGYGPILRTPDNRRIKLIITPQDEIQFYEL